MKATFKKGDLLPVLSKIQGLTGRRTNLAITTNILIKTDKKGLSISATGHWTSGYGVGAGVGMHKNLGSCSMNFRNLQF